MIYTTQNICASTEVAVNMYHMFRNNVVNMVLNDFPRPETIQYEDEEYTPEEGEVKPFDNERLRQLATLLQNSNCQKIQIFDIVTEGNKEKRLVSFRLCNRLEGKRVTMNIEVTSRFIDGDLVSGHTAWTTELVKVQVDDGDGLDIATLVKTRFEDAYLSPAMRGAVGGLLIFC